MRLIPRSAGAAAFAVLLYVGCASYDGAPMQASDDPVARALRMPDEDYFRIDEERQRRLQTELAVMSRWQGTALAAPARVEVDRRDALPLLWATRSSVLRNWQVQRLRNVSVVVADLVTGRVSVHDVHHGPKKVDYRNVPRSREGAPPAAAVAEGATASTQVLDARTFANLPWEPGRVAVTLLLHDWRSNTAVVELVRTAEPPRDPAKARRSAADSRAALERVRRRTGAVPPALEVGRSRATPALAGPGLVLSAPPSFAADEGRWMVHGAARVRLAPGAILDPSVADAPEAPAAVVTVALFLSQLDRPLPRTIEVEVPVRGASLAAGDEVEACFSVDLRAELGGVPDAGEYLLYAAAVEHVTGPVPFVVR